MIRSVTIKSKLIIVSGVLVSLLGAAGLIWQTAVIRFLATPYADTFRRLREEPRLARYPVLILFFGVSLILFGLFRSGRLSLPVIRLPKKTILTGVIALGVVLSIREWRYFGSPVWDGYGEFSGHFYKLLVLPGSESLDAFREFTQGYIHSGSPLAPFLIALLNILFRDITRSYMVLMFLSTLGTAFLLRKILRVFWYIPSALSIDYLILFFSHCVVMRSLLFPQTDALGMFWSTLVIYLGCAYLRGLEGRYLLLATLGITAAILTKVNGFFLAPLIPVLYLLSSLNKGDFQAWEFGRTVLFSAVIPSGLFLAYLWGLDVFENFLHEVSLRGVVDDYGIRYDNNFKLFIISSLITFQVYLRLIWKRGNLKRKVNLVPAIFVATTIVLLVLGSSTFFLRRFLPLIPALLLLSSANLEKIRQSSLSGFNILILWTIILNCLVLWLHLYY